MASPVSDQAATQGLGGTQGGFIVGTLVVLVLALAFVIGQIGTGETLSQVQEGAGTAESLAGIAQRVAASL